MAQPAPTEAHRPRRPRLRIGATERFVRSFSPVGHSIAHDGPSAPTLRPVPRSTFPPTPDTAKQQHHRLRAGPLHSEPSGRTTLPTSACRPPVPLFGRPLPARLLLILREHQSVPVWKYGKGLRPNSPRFSTTRGRRSHSHPIGHPTLRGWLGLGPAPFRSLLPTAHPSAEPLPSVGVSLPPPQPRCQPTTPAQDANAQPKVSAAKVVASRWSAPPMRRGPLWGTGRSPRTHREQSKATPVSAVPGPGRGLMRRRIQQQQQRPLAECGALRAVLIGAAPKPPYRPPLRSRRPRLPQSEKAATPS